MKTRYLISAFSLLLVYILTTGLSYSQYDPGVRDTVRLGEWIVHVVGPPYQGTAILPVAVFNDEPVGHIEIPLTWRGPLSCDSGKFVGERPQYSIVPSFTYNNDSRWMVASISAGGDGPLIPPGEGNFLLIYFSVLDTGLVSVDTISMFGFLHLYFSDSLAYTIIPQFTSTEFPIIPSVVGDINGDGVVNIGDVVFLIVYLYKEGAPPDFPEQADLNGDCKIDLGDVVYLISYLYKDGPAPLTGCAS